MSKRVSASLDDAYKLLLVLIPAYNAASTIGKVVRDVKQVSPDLRVLVVDDGSTDGTGDVAQEAGATVVRHTCNMGKGAALRTGFGRFLDGVGKAVVTLDADGQHSPHEIPRLVERWLDKNADIVIGARERHVGRMPLLRIFTNAVSSWLVSLSSGRDIADSQSGFRLFTRKVIEDIKTKSNGYAAESEILIRAASASFTIDSAPISTIYHREKSYIHPFKQPILFIGLIMKSFFWRFERIGTKGPK